MDEAVRTVPGRSHRSKRDPARIRRRTNNPFAPARNSVSHRRGSPRGSDSGQRAELLCIPRSRRSIRIDRGPRTGGPDTLGPEDTRRPNRSLRVDTERGDRPRSRAGNGTWPGGRRGNIPP